MIISFGWTAPALLAQEKTSTLREWDGRYAARFHGGQLVDAWNRSPRAHGWKVADLRLRADPEAIVVADLADDLERHWRAEGFAYFHDHPEAMPRTLFGQRTAGWDFSLEWFADWVGANLGRPFWLVRFEVLGVSP